MPNKFVQVPLSLPYRKAFGREDFLMSPCNLEAVRWIDKYPDWPVRALLICGERGSGKTHLASIFSDYHLEASQLDDDFLPPLDVKKVVVENVDNLGSEKALFHLYNHLDATGGALLLTALKTPRFALPDLQSRVNAIPKAIIQMPDEELIYAVLIKSFLDRCISVELPVLDYAVKRITRSFSFVQALVEKADMLSLSSGRKITIPVMKEALYEVNQDFLSSDAQGKQLSFF